MSKRILSIALAMLLIIYAAGCGANNADTAGKVSDEATEHTTQPQGPAEVSATEAITEAPTTEAPTESVTIDEGLLTVELTYTFEYWGIDDPSSFDPEECARFWGIDEARMDMDNETITIVMTKRRQQEILSESIIGIDGMISNYLDPEHEAYTPGIVSITHDEDLTAFTITVESGADENEYSFIEALLMLSTAYYHLFSGYTEDVVVDTIDASTGEIISENIY